MGVLILGVLILILILRGSDATCLAFGRFSGYIQLTALKREVSEDFAGLRGMEHACQGD
jgi:hypothetical protein